MENCIIRPKCHELCHRKKNAIELKLRRNNLNENDLNIAMLKEMTGVKVSWNYSNNVKSVDPLYQSKHKELRI